MHHLFCSNQSSDFELESTNYLNAQLHPSIEKLRLLALLASRGRCQTSVRWYGGGIVCETTVYHYQNSATKRWFMSFTQFL